MFNAALVEEFGVVEAEKVSETFQTESAACERRVAARYSGTGTNKGMLLHRVYAVKRAKK